MLKKSMSLCLLLSGMMLFACSSNVSLETSAGSSIPSSSNSSATAPTIQYQFTGRYTDSTLSSLGFDYYVILNLLSDGSVEGSGYNCLSMNTSPAASNDGFYEEWFVGSWEEGKDEEDQDCVLLHTEYGDDATNLMDGGTPLTGSFDYNLYFESDNSCSFVLDIPVFSGRTTEVTSNGDILYENYDEFIVANGWEYAEPENSLVQFVDETNHFKLYVLGDNTTVLTNGTLDPANNEYRYKQAKTGTWKLEEGSLIFTFDEADYTAVISGTSATLSYRYVIFGQYGTDLTLICNDISALLD